MALSTQLEFWMLIDYGRKLVAKSRFFLSPPLALATGDGGCGGPGKAAREGLWSGRGGATGRALRQARAWSVTP